MKMLNMKCPNCNANLTVAPDKTEAKCEHCGATFLIDDEHIHIDFDAEQAGYDFEKGRQRAQEEAEGIEYIEPDVPALEPAREKENVSATDNSHEQYNAGSFSSLPAVKRRVSPYAIVGIVVLLLIASIGIERGASRGSGNQSEDSEDATIAEIEDEDVENLTGPDDTDAIEASEEYEAPGQGEQGSEAGADSEEGAEVGGLDQVAEEQEQEPVDGTELKGRGFCDYEYKEPQYVGVSGYIAIYKYDDAMLSFQGVPETPWYVPKYAMYNGRYIDTEDDVEHKTKIKVLEQNLHYGDVAKYDGYLLVEDENGEQFYIDVDNFVTKAYWDFDRLEDALDVGYYIAEYHQKSDVIPVTHDNEPVYLEEGTRVFVRNFVPGEWSVITTKPHPDTTPVEALVWGGWFDVNEYGARGICFNTEDLTIVY